MYLLAEGAGWHAGLERRFEGVVVYADGSEKRISADSVDDAFVARLAEFMRKMTSDMPPRRVPSMAECGWCELTTADCPDRDGALTLIDPLQARRASHRRTAPIPVCATAGPRVTQTYHQRTGRPCAMHAGTRHSAPTARTR